MTIVMKECDAKQAGAGRGGNRSARTPVPAMATGRTSSRPHRASGAFAAAADNRGVADEPEKSDAPSVKTSERGWLARVAQAYRARESVVVVDDAHVGFDPQHESLIQMAVNAKLSPRELAAVAVSVGMGAAGVGMVVLAFLDPEPTSKLGLLVGGGVACVLGGGFGAIRVLTRVKPPRVRLTARGIEIGWD